MTQKAIEGDAPGPGEDALGRILEHRDKFLGFLTARVEDRETAEDILQSAYMKALDHGSEIRDGESTVAWFYRILRNATTDHYRRRAARAKAHESFAAEAPTTYEPKLEEAACACVNDVVRHLKREYREAIERVDLGGASVDSFAEAEHISPNNASVRLYRARKMLAQRLTTVCGACAEHKCVDCTCRGGGL